MTGGGGDVLTTPLHALHCALGAKMVAFAGSLMPVHYPTGILAEHHHTRTAASLFDVSHMGQLVISGRDRAFALERLVPGDILSLAAGRVRYTLLTDEQGGILDDVMVSNEGDHLSLVVNASRKQADLAHLRAGLPAGAMVQAPAGRALLALQGPAAAPVMARLAPDSAAMAFMQCRSLALAGVSCMVTRSGYTGEDGFEISLPADQAEAIARRLLTEPEVAPAGLGARDSLRLEAGLCLYGADIDSTTTPVEAGLAWTISRRRREQGGFPGAAVILRQLTMGPPRCRVGLKSLDKAPARAHTPITDAGGRPIGAVTSGGYGPTVGGPVAMGYVEAAGAAPGTTVKLVVRGTPRAAEIVAMPFVPHRYFGSGRCP